MHLEDLKNNAVIRGILPDSLATSSYEGLCPRQSVRFLLADDPGAGKTIRALGLVISQNTPLGVTPHHVPEPLVNHPFYFPL
ncbi:MAG: hypothetical protein V2I32_13255 [Desulforhopalus sp.]|jgi:hypothetical protein|nr:hypothetical protein [Desulforhopalus sp.]